MVPEHSAELWEKQHNPHNKSIEPGQGFQTAGMTLYLMGTN